MKHRLATSFVLTLSALLIVTAPTAAGTFTCLSCGDEHPSWGVTRINNLGHVALTRAWDSAYGGPVYLWTGSWETKTEYTSSAVYNSRFQPKLELNDNDRIAFQANSSQALGVSDLSGPITLSPPATINYAIDINDSNSIAAYSYQAWLNNHIYTADDPYVSFSDDVGPADIIQFRVAINNQGQVAWKPPAAGTLHRFTPGVGSEAIGPANHAPFDIDDLGRIIHVRDENYIMLNNMVLRSSPNVWPGSGWYAQPRISDNGRYVLRTEYDGTRWDLWTLVDGIPTDLTEGNYHNALSPDVNNDGLVVFASVESFSYPYGSDAYMYTPDPETLVVYNGHFDGETLFGWEPESEGDGSVELVSAGGGFAAELTSGSPVSITQAVVAPDGASTLSFGMDFLTSNGTLAVSLGGNELAQLTSADDTEPGFTTIEVSTATRPMGRDEEALKFVLDDASPAVVMLDDIQITEDETGVEDDPEGIGAIALGLPIPNPSSSGATLTLTLRSASHVTAAVYGADGRLVRVLVDERLPAGTHRLSWDGKTLTGARAASGVYFIRATGGGDAASSKALVVR